MRKRYDLHDLAAEVVRRADSSHIIRLSIPPTPTERLQLLAARLEGRPIAIMPIPCETMDEWVRRYGPDDGPL
jgi:hypothetical protein